MILYIETNFLMSIATGRDAQAYNLLQNKPASVCLTIPSICYMEALTALEEELKRRNRFTNELTIQVSQLRRDLTSSHARILLSYLEQALIENQAVINDVEERLFQAIELLETKAEIINITGTILKESLNTRLIDEEPTDNLILQCILSHANQHTEETKVLLSGNVKEFNRQEVQEYYRNVGIIRYFSNTQNFLGWWQGQTDL